MKEFSFQFECTDSFRTIDVHVDENGAVSISQSLSITDFCKEDQYEIRSKVMEYIEHHMEMEAAMDEPHPADEAFGTEYIDWLNKGCP